MRKNEENSIHVIDSSVRGQMQLLDRHDDNYFGEALTLITNYRPYAPAVVLGRPCRTPEHRVMLVRLGTLALGVSCDDHALKEGHLLVIPANSVLVVKAQSDNLDLVCVAFRIPEAEGLGLVGHRASHLALSGTDRRLVESHFHLLELLVKSGPALRQGVVHQVLSMLHSIHALHQEASHPVAPVRPGRAQEIMSEFTRLLHEQEYPVRKPEYYADRLNITKGHLADVVKESSGRTTMDWINERTILLAQAMLSSTTDMVATIGERLSLGDTSQFVKFFKKHTGETPNAYRKRMKT